jgi:FemAB-related protein (PEP-CTERM system-associated)
MSDPPSQSALPTTPAPTPATVPLRVAPLTDDDFEAWDHFVLGATGGTLFHTTSWKSAVEDGFGHRAFYFAAWRRRNIVGVLPMFEVRSLLGGTMFVSVPYGVYGGVLTDEPEAREMLLAKAVADAEARGSRSVELRSEVAVWPVASTSDKYVTFRGRLPRRTEDCLSRLPRKARAAARTARERYKLSASHGAEYLPVVWRLYCRSMRRLGSLNYPYGFFESLIRGTPGGHIVTLLRHNDTPVAGLVTLLYNGCAMPYFVGFGENANRLHAANFVYLTAMEEAVRRGYMTFDFGRSRVDNVGACAFKRNQGFEPTPLAYQLYTLNGRTAPNLAPSNPWFAPARRIWPVLPEMLTRPFGAWLSKHVPG